MNVDLTVGFAGEFALKGSTATLEKSAIAALGIGAGIGAGGMLQRSENLLIERALFRSRSIDIVPLGFAEPAILQYWRGSAREVRHNYCNQPLSGN